MGTIGFLADISPVAKQNANRVKYEPGPMDQFRVRHGENGESVLSERENRTDGVVLYVERKRISA